MNHCTNCNANFEGNFCPTCGLAADVSKKATMQSEKSVKCSKTKKPFYKRTWFIVLAILIAVSAIGGGIAGSSSTEKPSNESTSNSETQSNSKENQDTASSKEEDKEKEKLVNGMHQDFVDAMDSYEAFMDEYIAFMENYNKNPSDLSLLTQYSTYMTKYMDCCNKFEEWESDDLNTIETAYYLEVQLRVNQKLMAASICMN